MSVLIAARTLGELSGWRLTNLEMHKMLYVAHMLHLGRTGMLLVDEDFEAWDYGPVLPSLYKAVKNHKHMPIPAFNHVHAFEPGSPERVSIEEAYALTRHLRPGELIRLTHRDGGAWDANYDGVRRSAKISTADILAEFECYMLPSDDAVGWAEQMADQVAATPSRYLCGERKRAFRARVLPGHLH